MKGRVTFRAVQGGTGRAAQTSRASAYARTLAIICDTCIMQSLERALSRCRSGCRDRQAGHRQDVEYLVEPERHV